MNIIMLFMQVNPHCPAALIGRKYIFLWTSEMKVANQKQIKQTHVFNKKKKYQNVTHSIHNEFVYETVRSDVPLLCVMQKLCWC